MNYYQGLFLFLLLGLFMILITDRFLNILILINEINEVYLFIFKVFVYFSIFSFFKFFHHKEKLGLFTMMSKAD